MNHIATSIQTIDDRVREDARDIGDGFTGILRGGDVIPEIGAAEQGVGFAEGSGKCGGGAGAGVWKQGRDVVCFWGGEVREGGWQQWEGCSCAGGNGDCLGCGGGWGGGVAIAGEEVRSEVEV
jgi:hypothetical protein